MSSESVLACLCKDWRQTDDHNACIQRPTVFSWVIYILNSGFLWDFKGVYKDFTFRTELQSWGDLCIQVLRSGKKFKAN